MRGGVDVLAHAGLHAAVDDGVDVFLDDLARQAEDRDADADLAAEVRLALEDRHSWP